MISAASRLLRLSGSEERKQERGRTGRIVAGKPNLDCDTTSGKAVYDELSTAGKWLVKGSQKVSQARAFIEEYDAQIHEENGDHFEERESDDENISLMLYSGLPAFILGFRKKNHVQICVRNRARIKGYFHVLSTPRT